MVLVNSSLLKTILKFLDTIQGLAFNSANLAQYLVALF
jgi:hypothetical protein